MSVYSEFFLNSSSNVVQLELLELSHSSFSKVYRIVRNACRGVTVTLETAEVATFDYYPLRIERGSTKADLDQSFNIILGDVGEVLPVELDNVAAEDAFGEMPRLVYRTYRSDVLTEPLFGPIELEVESFGFDRQGASFTAKAPNLNINKTGEVYSLERFPMLRGFL